MRYGHLCDTIGLNVLAMCTDKWRVKKKRRLSSLLFFFFSSRTISPCYASQNCSTGYVFSRYLLSQYWWQFYCIRVSMYYVNACIGLLKSWCVILFYSFFFLLLIQLTWHLNGSNWRRVFKYHFSLLICRCRNSRCPQRHHHLLFVMCNIIRFFLVAVHIYCVRVTPNMSLLLCKQ